MLYLVPKWLHVSNRHWHGVHLCTSNFRVYESMLYGCTVLLCFNTALQPSIAFESLTRHICDPSQISPNFSKNTSNLSPQGSSKWNLSSLDFTMPAGKDLKLLRILPKNSWVLTDRNFKEKNPGTSLQAILPQRGNGTWKAEKDRKGLKHLYILKKNTLKHFCRKHKFPKNYLSKHEGFDSWFQAFKPSSLHLDSTFQVFRLYCKHRNAQFRLDCGMHF